MFITTVTRAQTYDIDLLFAEAGANGEIFAATSSGSDVYVGGKFSKVGGVTTNNIAKWDGLKWDTLKAGVQGTVRALLVKGDELYVEGNFTIPGLTDVYCMAKWNMVSKQWLPIGSGKYIGANLDAAIYTLSFVIR